MEQKGIQIHTLTMIKDVENIGLGIDWLKLMFYTLVVETFGEPTFKYSVNTSFLYNKERKEYTANVYRDLRVLYREIRVGDRFKFMGIACYPQSLQ